MKNSIERNLTELSDMEVNHVAGGMGIQADQVCRFVGRDLECKPAPQQPRPFPFPGVPVIN